LALLVVPAVFLYSLQHGLCDLGTCPTGNWLQPLLLVLLGVGVVGTVFIWFLRRWNNEEP
jgi:hypothetical protein